MVVNEEIKKEWFDALSKDSLFLTNEYTKAFKQKHESVYRLFHSFYRIRTELRQDLEAMASVGLVNWFTLTFDNKHDKSLINTKRKSATRFLNDLFLCYVIVEEFGEDNNRYHIHGFGVYRDNKGFIDFCKWHSRNKIECLTPAKINKKVKYLTNYMVKDIPRIRRSKSMCYLRDRFMKAKRVKSNFKNCFECQLKLSVLRLRLGIV